MQSIITNPQDKKRMIKAKATRVLEQWASNVLHDGDDLGLPHVSPEQKMAGGSGTRPPELTDEEETILAYMASLPNREPKLHKIANLHFIEKDWWISEVRRRGFWLKAERGRKADQTPSRIRQVILRYISRDDWMDKIRARGFNPHRPVGHRQGRLVLGDSEVFITNKPKVMDWLMYVEINHGIKKTDYYELLDALQRRVYYLVN